MDAMLKVEAISNEAVETVKKAVLEVLNTRADQETIRLALTVLKESVEVGQVLVTNNVLTVNNDEDCDGIKID